jgi:acyl-CoA hydrolase
MLRKVKMSFVSYTTNRLVKGEDLNHHGTLYAGRTSEWFVEAGFVAAANMTNPENIVCLQIHNMMFSRPVHKGDVVCLESRIVYAGKTSMVANIQMQVHAEEVLNGFITFVHVDKNGNPLQHGITVTASSPEEVALQEHALQLRK